MNMILCMEKANYERLMKGFEVLGYESELTLDETQSLAEVHVKDMPYKFSIYLKDGIDQVARIDLTTNGKIDFEVFQKWTQDSERAIYYYYAQTNPLCSRCQSNLKDIGIYKIERSTFYANPSHPTVTFEPSSEPIRSHYHCTKCHQSLDENVVKLLNL